MDARHVKGSIHLAMVLLTGGLLFTRSVGLVPEVVHVSQDPRGVWACNQSFVNSGQLYSQTQQSQQSQGDMVVRSRESRGASWSTFER